MSTPPLQQIRRNMTLGLIITSMIGILCLTTVIVVMNNTLIHKNHHAACQQLEGDALKAYVLGLQYLDKITSKATFHHIQEVKLLPKPE